MVVVNFKSASNAIKCIGCTKELNFLYKPVMTFSCRLHTKNDTKGIFAKSFHRSSRSTFSPFNASFVMSNVVQK